MSHVEFALGYRRADLLRQPQESHGVRDRRPILADALAGLFLGEAVLLAQPAVGVGLFQRIEILSLEVLDERDLEGGLVAKILHERGDIDGAPPSGQPASGARLR